MTGTRFLGWLLAIVTLIVAVSPIVRARSLRDLSCDESMCIGGARFEKMLEYYSMHARVWLGQEKRLSNGVAWRLLIDTPTGLAVPRITWMPDGRAMQKANRLLDAIHGQELVGYAGQAKYWQEVYEEAAREGEKDNSGVSLMIPRDHFIQQHIAALTYATSKLVSYYDVGTPATDGMSKVPRPYGQILDLQQGKVFSIESCAEEDESSASAGHDSEVMFRLGDWLEVCDMEAVTSFLRLYAKNLEIATKRPAFRRDPYAEFCVGFHRVLDDGRTCCSCVPILFSYGEELLAARECRHSRDHSLSGTRAVHEAWAVARRTFTLEN